MPDRLSALRELLISGDQSTQDELREKLEKQKFQVTQSTISRDLRKLGAVRAVDAQGRTVYRLPEQEPTGADGLKFMVKSVKSNSSMVVIHTSPGTASLVARHLDLHCANDILGTIAGDDTVFVALSTNRGPSDMLKTIQKSLSDLG